MARIAGMFNPEAEAQQDIGCIPSGEYLAQITDSDMKPTKKNDGEFLELEYTVMDGEFTGRKVWVRLNLSNPSDKAVEIANRQFAAIREATGVLNPDDSTKLHYKPHVIRVELIPAGTTQKNGYTTQKDTNEVRGWHKAEGVVPSGGQAAAAPAQPQASAAPWRKVG